jgi:hypothetical protein
MQSATQRGQLASHVATMCAASADAHLTPVLSSQDV